MMILKKRRLSSAFVVVSGTAGVTFDGAWCDVFPPLSFGVESVVVVLGTHIVQLERDVGGNSGRFSGGGGGCGSS